MDEGYMVKSLARALKVLECFSIEQPELGVSEIAKMLGMQKSTVFNVLYTYQKMGYVEKDPDNSKYRLGLKALHLGYIINHNLGLRDTFMPYLTRIANEVNEVCYLGIPDNLEVLYLEAVYPSTQMHTRNILGERAPLYCTGLGKAMLAFMSDSDIEQALIQEMKPFTNFTICDPKELRSHLEEIRLGGYALDNMEHEYGVRCVAVPVFAADGRVAAAVSVSGPSLRFDSETVSRDAKIIQEILRPLQRCM